MLPDRFWDKVNKLGPDDCWEWTASRHAFGYGWYRVQGKTVGAHRLALMDATGENGEGLEAIHSCDNPPCVNPAHLRWGTSSDNTQDAIKRGRASMPPKNDIDPPLKKGSENGNSKLTENDVIEIKVLLGLEVTGRKIAADFGISQSTVSQIRNGKTWVGVG